MRNGFRTLVAISLLLTAGVAQALGLGDPLVKSFLNQPLEVEIELLAVTPAEAESVTAQLATIKDYQRVGIGKLRLSVPLNFSVYSTSRRAFILVESKEPVRDPIVQLLLDVRWSRGRLLKEYTLFLDPATVPVAAPRIVTQPRPVIEPPPRAADSRLAEPPGTIEPQQAEPELSPAVPPGSENTTPVATPADEAPFREDLPVAEIPVEKQIIADETPVAEEPVVTTLPADGEPEAADPKQEEPVVADEPAGGQAVATEAPAEQEPAATEVPIEQETAATDIPDQETESIGEEPLEAEAVAEEEPPVAEAPAEDKASVAEDSVEEEAPIVLAPVEEELPVTQAAPSEPVARVISAEVNYGPVERGDTLWHIAKDWIKGTEFSINQAMITIALVNPRAFRHGNINRLQQGAVLRFPEDWEVARLGRAEANRTVAEHIDAWRRNIPLPPAVPIVSDAGSDPGSATEVTPEIVPDSGSQAQITEAEIDPEATEPELPRPRLQLVPSELDSDDLGSGESATEREQRAQLRLVQQLLQEAERKMRSGSGNKEELQAEIDNLRASVLELSRVMNLDDADLAALAARSREARNRDNDGGSQSLEELLAEARQSVDKPDANAAAAKSEEPESLPWWEQGWFILILGLILLVGFVIMLRRGANAGPADYGRKSLADTLVEEEEEHADYSAADVPGVEPEDFGDDLSTLTEEAEDILKALEQENLQKPAKDPDSIYEGVTQEEEVVVAIDGTTVTEIDMDEDELAQFLAETRPDPVPIEETGDDGQDSDILPEGEDAMAARLDLAIAYLGSGNRDNAHKLLHEVIENGDEQQQAAAQKLLDEH